MASINVSSSNSSYSCVFSCLLLLGDVRLTLTYDVRLTLTYEGVHLVMQLDV